MKQGSMWGGALLVAGMTIGAGMLALPVVTGEAGLLPSIAILCVYWLASLGTGLLFLEVNLVFDTPVNFVTMAKKTLGTPGKVIAWGIYLLLLYSLTAAYIAGSKAFMNPYLFLLLFGALVAFSTRIIDRANRFLMAGLLVSYVLLLLFGIPAMQEPFLMRENWGALWTSVPIVVTAFGFQIIIPSLTTYLHRDVKRIKQALIWGSSMAFLFYALFQLIMLGAIPLGLIQSAGSQGDTATSALAKLHGNNQVTFVAKWFAFFAITTSFIGVSLSLRDFLADGLKSKKNIGLLFLTYLPPLAFVAFYPRAFLVALDFAGFLVALLLGVWPVLMVYRKRQLKLPSAYRAPGGMAMLVAIVAIYAAVIVIGFIK